MRDSIPRKGRIFTLFTKESFFLPVNNESHIELMSKMKYIYLWSKDTAFSMGVFFATILFFNYLTNGRGTMMFSMLDI